MISTVGKSVTAFVIGIVGSLMAAFAVAWMMGVPLPSRHSASEIVTADLVGIANEQTLDLASRNLEPEELTRQSRAWARDFQQLLGALARDNNIVILPAGLGVYGARDITGELRRFMEQRQ